MEDNRTLMDRLKSLNRQTLEKEQKDLQDRQAYLRKKKETLQERREDLRDTLYKAMAAKDETTRSLADKQLDELRNDIQEINSEYKTNSEALEKYSMVIKNKDEGKSSIWGTLFAGVGTGAAIWLGKKSLDKAYEANVEGQLVNKGPLDVFNRLNPLRLINHFRR